ncbi:glycine receptor subunit alpha-4-like [Lepeophtheirus salmonis]|uniref:glycine receptor subunit alpha-4-like n=1 Tax=Lepeophtheirus salmonis TaxID=72036 RepID=UPI003AF38CDC
MNIHLRREIGYHIVQTYIPSMIFVIVAWLSLFIPPESIPGMYTHLTLKYMIISSTLGRVGMSLTTLLALTAMFGAVRSNVPKVSYVSYLDIWIVTCIVFVFFCTLEFSIVSYSITSGWTSFGYKVDRYCQLAIPLGFIVFNMKYWSLMSPD